MCYIFFWEQESVSPASQWSKRQITPSHLWGSNFILIYMSQLCYREQRLKWWVPHFTEVLGSEPVRQTCVTLGLSRSASWDCASTNKCLGIKTQPSQGRTARPRDKQISKPTTHLSKVSAPGFQGISPKGDGPRHLISFQELHQLGKQDDRKQLSQAGQGSQT